MSENRTNNSVLNISSNFIVLIMKTLFTFITRTIFIHCLGKEALGINGLFTNVLSMLSLAELGIGQAINFSLYKPLSVKDKDKVSRLMSFYKKVYRIIGSIVILLGIIMIPFLKYVVKDIGTINNVYVIYILYLLNTGSTYFISYKETLIIADQKKYKLTLIETLFTIALNILQILFLIITKNFIVYLSIQFLVTLIQRIITNVYITSKYSFINFNSKNKIDKEDKATISKNVKAMFFHKIGDYCINGTDNIIISSFINITTVGLYSNYLTIINLINSIVATIYNGLTASLGNLIVTESSDKRYLVFNKMNFISFLLHGYTFVVLINIFNDFITIWAGSDYVLNFNMVLCILISFYLTGMRVPCSITKSAAGLYDIDKFTPIIQAFTNLIVSIVLVKKIGLLGVIIGTIISSIVLPSWQRPYIVYKYVLNRSPKEYFVAYLKYVIIICIASLITLFLFSIISFNNLIVTIIVKTIVVTLVFMLLVFIIFKNKEEYKYIKKIIRSILNARKIS